MIRGSGLLAPGARVPPGAGSQRAAPYGGAGTRGKSCAGGAGAASAAGTVAVGGWSGVSIWLVIEKTHKPTRNNRTDNQSHETQSLH